MTMLFSDCVVVPKVSLVCLTTGCPSLLLADTASALQSTTCNMGVAHS